MCLTSPAVITGADMDVFQGDAGLSAPVAQASAETPLQGSAVFGFLGDWGFIGADRLIPLISATVNGLLSAAAQQTSSGLLEAHPEPVSLHREWRCWRHKHLWGRGTRGLYSIGQCKAGAISPMAVAQQHQGTPLKDAQPSPEMG